MADRCRLGRKGDPAAATRPLPYRALRWGTPGTAGSENDGEGRKGEQTRAVRAAHHGVKAGADGGRVAERAADPGSEQALPEGRAALRAQRPRDERGISATRTRLIATKQE